MTARNSLLMAAAALALAACASTKVVSTAPEPSPAATTVASAPSQPLVVRSPLVPDDDEVTTQASAEPAPHVTKHHASSGETHHAAAEPATAPEPTAPPPEKPAKPEKPSKTAKTDKTDKTTLADNTPAPTTPPSEPPAATPPSSTPPAGPSPSDTTTPDTSSQPAASQPAVTDLNSMKSLLSDPAKLMKAQIAGFPVWLIGLVAVLLLVALIIGFGGRRKSDEVV